MRDRRACPDGAPTDPPAGGPAAEEAIRAPLLEALGLLPEPLREAIVLRDVRGLSYGEIAARAGLSPQVVKHRVNRARLGLCRQLGLDAVDADGRSS